MATQRKNPNSSNSKKSMNKKKQQQQQQPFSDISNFNLIPTATLLKLVSSSSSASSSSSKVPNVLPKSPIANSVSKSDSNTTCKPYNISPNNNSTEVVSETSVASNNFSSGRNPNHVDVSSVRRAALRPINSITPGRDDEVVVSNRRQTTKKSNLEATALPSTSSCHEKKKDKKKAIADPYHILPPTVTKDKGKLSAEPLPPTITKGKGKAIAEPLPLIITKDKQMAIAEPFTSLSPKIKVDKGKGVAVLSTPVSGNKKKTGIHEPLISSPQTAKAKAKDISHAQVPSDEKTAEERSGVLSRNMSSLIKTRGQQRADASAFSCPALPKTRTNRTEFNGTGDIKQSGPRTDPNGKCKKRRRTKEKSAPEDSLPRDFISYWQEHYKAVDDFELPEEEASYSDLD